MARRGLAERGNRRATSRRAHAVDRLAEGVITIGGMAVLAAVLGICVYLVYEVAPLFGGGSAEYQSDVGSPPGSTGMVSLDETGRVAITVDADGVLSVTLLGSGDRFGERRVTPEGVTVTASSVAPGGRRIALGLSDGTAVFGEVGFDTTLVAADRLSESARAIAVGSIVRASSVGLDEPGAVLDRPNEDRYRLTTPVIELSDPVELASGSEVTHIDHQESPAGRLFMVARHADGEAVYQRIRMTRPLGGGTPRVRTTGFTLDLAQEPEWLFASGSGAYVIALQRDGSCVWFDTAPRRPEEPISPKASVRLAPEGVGVAGAAWLLGSDTLLVAGEDGVVRSWFVANDAAAEGAGEMRVSHSLGSGSGDVQAVVSSGRDRIAAILSTEGERGVVRLRHLTSEKVIAEFETGLARPAGVFFSSDGSRLLVVGEDGAGERWAIDPGHAEAGFVTLFGKVLYEGATEPAFVYQSSAGSDAAEAKLSLTPLIFGTLKATVFAMLFAAPIAVLAALYSSEFLSPNAHKVVKPTLELMASLPSVVLGFIAAFVAAPFVRDWLPSVIVAMVIAPVVAVLCAHAWSAAPSRLTERVGATQKLLLIALVLAGGVLLSVPAGRALERGLFNPSAEERALAAGLVEEAEAPDWLGEVKAAPTRAESLRLRSEGLAWSAGRVVRPDVSDPGALPEAEPSLRRWLDGAFGGAKEGWLVALFGPALIVISVARAKLLGRRIADISKSLGRVAAPALGAGLVVADLLVAFGVVSGLGSGLEALGLDPRDSIFGAFSQRNTLVVGLIMGFAVIPIIYTISDDAMRSVPAGLRSASLGAGATPWQTAVRVVLPVAASGIFSAVMIGLGRAVGETMIVLMATGNTPVMEWNIFGGFRTLAANIAVELPEAPKDSTHYRVLFLCGLVLFAMTFVINTTAELVRQRFRKRNASL